MEVEYTQPSQSKFSVLGKRHSNTVETLPTKRQRVTRQVPELIPVNSPFPKCADILFEESLGEFCYFGRYPR